MSMCSSYLGIFASQGSALKRLEAQLSQPAPGLFFGGFIQVPHTLGFVENRGGSL